MRHLDGRTVTADELAVLALTNYGHFTSMRVENGRVRGLSHHLERLVRDCRAVFDADLDADGVRDRISAAVGAGKGTFVVRVTVYDPGLEMGHPGNDATPRVLVTSRPAAGPDLPPLTAQCRHFVRELPLVKHIGLFGQLHQRRLAQRAGFDDALFVGPDELVSEGVTWNVGFIAGDRVVWPNSIVLPGVTMALLRQHGQHEDAPVRLAQLGLFDAAFACNTSIGVRPISRLDIHEYPVDHPVMKSLSGAFLGDPGEAL